MEQTELPTKVASNAVLGPLPEPDMSHRKALDDCDEETSYSAEAMEKERQRCYALALAHEQELMRPVLAELTAQADALVRVLRA